MNNLSFKTASIFCLFFLASILLQAETVSIKSLEEEKHSNRRIVFQPQFVWANNTSTKQGTGSFVRTPSGVVAALTSAHFINFSGPQLLEVHWLDVKTGQPIVTCVKSWGMPGKEGNYETLDLRSDYFLMVVDHEVCSNSVLEIDERNAPKIGERIWFPNKNSQARLGYDRIEGVVIESQNTYSIIHLDWGINLNSRSGTPVVSQDTGKVIGILTGGEKKGRKTVLYLAPASSIHQALVNAQEYPLLRHVVGN